MIRPIHPTFGAFSTLIVVGLLTGCIDSLPTSETPNLAKVKADDPVVTAADPSSAPQDTTSDVRVLGSNFVFGSTVTFKLGGKPVKKIVTNQVTFVNADELVANVTIAPDADVAAYDIEVLTPGKRRGVGTELFSVRQKDNGPISNELSISSWEGALWSPAGAVEGELTGDGRIWVATEHGKNKGTELCLDLSQLGGDGIIDQSNYDLFVQQVAKDPSSTEMTSVCTVVTMHTRDHSNADKAGGQAIGATEYSGGKIVLKDFATGNDSWEWRLIWDAAYGDTAATDLGEGVCIARPGPDTWLVFNSDDVAVLPPPACTANDGTLVDNIGELWRFVSGKGNVPGLRIHVAEFVFPFRFTATRVP